MWNFNCNRVFLMDLIHIIICYSKVMFNIFPPLGLSIKYFLPGSYARWIRKAAWSNTLHSTALGHGRKTAAVVPASARQSVGGVIESTETCRHIKRTYSDSSKDMERWNKWSSQRGWFFWEKSLGNPPVW